MGVSASEYYTQGEVTPVELSTSHLARRAFCHSVMGQQNLAETAELLDVIRQKVPHTAVEHMPNLVRGEGIDRCFIGLAEQQKIQKNYVTEQIAQPLVQFDADLLRG